MAIQEAPLTVVPALQCRSLDGWYPVEIASESDPDKSYVVHVNPWANRSEQMVCDCKSYHFRGRCRHQREAYERHCGWNAIEGPEQATQQQEDERICPRCEGPAGWAMWDKR